MSGPIINNLRRQIEDTRPKKGSMVAGHPKATVIIADLEGLIARHESLERQLSEANTQLQAVTGERDSARLEIKRLNEALDDEFKDRKDAASEAKWQERQGDEYGTY